MDSPATIDPAKVSVVATTQLVGSRIVLLVRAGELGVATMHLPLLWFGFHVVKSVGNMLVGRMVAFGRGASLALVAAILLLAIRAPAVPAVIT